MVSLSQDERYFAAHCALLFVTSIAALFVAIGLAWLAPRRNDPARLCLTLIKIAALGYILFCIIELTADAINIAVSRLVRSGYSDPNIFHNQYIAESLATLIQARIELDAASRLADCFAIVFVFLAIVSLSFGVTLVRTGGHPTTLDYHIRRVSRVFAVVLSVIAVVEWVVRVRTYRILDTENYDLDDLGEPTLKLLHIARQLDFAFVVIAWALSIAVMARSTTVWLPARMGKYLDTPLTHPTYLMLCSGAWLVRTTYEVVYQLKYADVQHLQRHTRNPAYMEIISVVFHTWPILAILCFMFALGAKKENGLWSKEQPFSTFNPNDNQGILLQPRNSSPPAYSSLSPRPPVHTGSSNSTSIPLSDDQSRQAHQSLTRPPGNLQEGQLGDHDRALVGNLGPPQRYQPPARDNAYNTGIVAPSSPSEAGPAYGYGIGMSIPSQSPPPHDEAMGLYHQADGRPPGAAPLPYPEKN